jgi:hypothetical protein
VDTVALFLKFNSIIHFENFNVLSTETFTDAQAETLRVLHAINLDTGNQNVLDVFYVVVVDMSRITVNANVSYPLVKLSLIPQK